MKFEEFFLIDWLSLVVLSFQNYDPGSDLIAVAYFCIIDV